VVLVAIGITAASVTLGAMSQAQFRLRQTQEMQRLAVRTLSDLIANGGITGGSRSDDGDYSSVGEPRYVWKAQESQAGIGNLDTIVVTVNQADDPQGRQVIVSSLYCRPPQPKTTGGTKP